jgi:hypothetical protein
MTVFGISSVEPSEPVTGVLVNARIMKSAFLVCILHSDGWIMKMR